MKKIIMTLAIALGSFGAFAADENVNKKVLDAFHNDFAAVAQVEWTAGNNYYRAAFIYNNKHVFVYYNTEGEMLGMTRYISSMDLPMSLQSSLKNNYGAYWISDLFEVAKHETTTYYLTVENADSKVILKSAGGGDWETYKTSKKI
jgi:hypothetical protein